MIADLRKIDKIWILKTNEVAVRGIPDIFICLRGLFIVIELKSEAGIEPEKLQTYNLDKIEQAGGIALTASPETWHLVLMKVAQIAKE